MNVKSRRSTIQRASKHRLSQFSFAMFAVFLAAVLPAVAQQTAGVTSVKIADSVCAPCHRSIYDSYLKTVMANASAPAAESATAATFHHKPSSVEYRVSLEGEKVWLDFSRPGEYELGGLQGRRLLEYSIGSGNRGRTFLYQVDHYWFESPINWYTAYGNFDTRPGFQNSITAPFNLPVASRCLHCHTSGVQLEIPGTQNRYSGPPFKHTGIICESCHGDSTAHVASSGKTAIANPQKLDPLRRDAICQQCHLEGELLIDRAGRKLAQFRPGELLTDFASYFVHAGAPNAGFGPVTQVEALPLSKCKQASGNSLSCTSCHDPHRKVAPEEKVSFYRAKCLQCHSQPQYTSIHHPENQDCASCHMPRNRATGIPHQQTTDHRIPRIAPVAQSLPATSEELQSVLTAHPDDRDLGLAYAKVAENGDESATTRATQLLHAARAKNPRDSALLAGLGFVLKKQGHDDQAIEALKAAIEIDPQNTWAAANLGVLYKKIGQTEKALQLWEEAFRRTPSYAGLNLSDLDCALGRRQQAQTALLRMRDFDPDSLEIRRRLNRIESCGQK